MSRPPFVGVFGGLLPSLCEWPVWLTRQTNGGSCIATTKDEALKGERATEGICKRDDNVQSGARTLWRTHFSLIRWQFELKHTLSVWGDAMRADWEGVDLGFVEYAVCVFAGPHLRNIRMSRLDIIWCVCKRWKTISWKVVLDIWMDSLPFTWPN